MDGVWLTYHELAEKLGSSAEGARRRAQRGRWTRQRGNDGLARVMVPNDALDGSRTVRAEDARGAKRAEAQALVIALREANAALDGHVATLKGDVERLEALLAVERGRADKAIGAFADLAERLDRLASSLARPWWRRIFGPG